MLRNGPRRIVKATGEYVFDEDGNRLLDGTAGLWCANIGHGRKEVGEALSNAHDQLDFFHTFGGYSNLPQEELASRLIKMAPPRIDHVFFGCTGSDANDTIVKIVWHYNNILGRPQKKKIISRWGAYHGTTIATGSLTGLKSFHGAYDLPIDRMLHTDCPHFYRFAKLDEDEQGFTDRLIRSLEDLIAREGAETIAAFIGEPVMGAGGVVPPPEGYWARVQDLCRDHDILLIADEVVCGFGRTGADFGSTHFGIDPDLMAVAKGLTAGVFPLSGALLSNEIWSVLNDGSKTFGGFSHGYTYSGHPIGTSVANTVLDIYERERLAANAKTVGSYLMSSLEAAFVDHPHVGEIRGVGLVCAIQLVSDRKSREFFDPGKKVPFIVSEIAYQKGLIVRPLPSVGALSLSPPLTLSKQQADEIVKIVIEAIDAGVAGLP